MIHLIYLVQSKVQFRITTFEQTLHFVLNVIKKNDYNTMLFGSIL